MYFVIYYSPRPWLGERVAVGAQVLQGVEFSVVGVIPLYMTGIHLHMVKHALDAAHRAAPGHLNVSAGPHVSIDGPRAVPDGVVDAALWVEELLSAGLKTE